jgi:hypothetical protein
LVGCAGGGGRRQRPKPAAARLGARRSSIEINAPRVKSTRVWVCHDQRGTCDPPGAEAGLGVIRAARTAAEAVLHGGAHRRAAFRSKQGPRSTTSSTKRTGETCRCSPRAWIDRKGNARWSAVRSERRGRAVLVGRAAAGVLRASDPHGSARGAPAEVPRGLRGSGGLTAASKQGGGASYRRRVSVKFRPLLV